jgi:hypothetical protein
METQPAPLAEDQLNDIETRAAYLHEYATLTDVPLQADADQLTGTDVPALLAELRRLRAERDEFCDRVDTLTAVAQGNKRHVQEVFLELQKARAALEEIRHLHKDSPMGPCPVCIDADAAAAGGDGLVPYPCPTGRLAGAQDCDPGSHTMTEQPVGPRCGNNPNVRLTPGDQQAVEEFKAYLKRRRAGGPPEPNPFTTAEEA